MKKSLLNKLSDKLTIEEITKGMNAAIKNSKRLLDDAKILLDAGSYPTALSLSILAIEEAGKVTILRRTLTASDNDLKECWQNYRNHRAKNAAWILPELASKGNITLLSLRETVNENGEHTLLLDTLKQIGFYTDFVGLRNWSVPDLVVDQELAESIWKVAETLCTKKEVSQKDNETWVKHLGPQSQHGVSLIGLQNYFFELIEKGLSDHNKEKVLKFIYGQQPE